jgi:hypothetical protein
MAKPAEIQLRPGWLEDDMRRARSHLGLVVLNLPASRDLPRRKSVCRGGRHVIETSDFDAYSERG